MLTRKNPPGDVIENDSGAPEDAEVEHFEDWLDAVGRIGNPGW
jgi:hypothetical protein